MFSDMDTAFPALTRLADRYGISTGYENAFGDRIAVPPETLSLLLGSMGVHASNEIDARQVLEALEGKSASQSLPPTIVVRAPDGNCQVIIRGSDLPTPLQWHLKYESGEEVSGSLDPEPGSHETFLSLSGVPLGYHHLRLPQLATETQLIACPESCWLPPHSGNGHWGIAVQLYLVRSESNWGIGDFSDLSALVEMAGAKGCSFIGLNPLHQMFLDSPEAASPYSPATRLFLNPLYIDVTAIPEWRQSEAAQALVEAPTFRDRLAACRDARLVDYSEVTALKLEALALVHQTFRDTAGQERLDALAAFQFNQGNGLKRASLFQTLRLHFARTNPEHADWRTWPADLLVPGSSAQREFEEAHQAELEFQDWLQFIADEQLEHASNAAKAAGMAIGLYRDLAVGCDASGAETWANPVAFLQRTFVGAPPDIFNPAGQNWGLPPFDPVALAQEGFRSFAELIRTNMRHAGGLRIDHVMGLSRLFCIPEGKKPAEGAYVAFPLDDLIGVLALESQRQQCLVVGEDLGTVPSGFRERMAHANILSYRVLFFEQDYHTGTFQRPEAYPQQAFAATGSHDLPTLMAWWQGADIALKQALGLFHSPEETASQHQRRDRERLNILAAFANAGLGVPAEPADLTAENFAEQACRYLALTPSTLLAIQLDDMTGDVEPVNIPGTWMEHPNWRRKYRLSLEDLAVDRAAWDGVAPLART